MALRGTQLAALTLGPSLTGEAAFVARMGFNKKHPSLLYYLISIEILVRSDKKQHKITALLKYQLCCVLHLSGFLLISITKRQSVCLLKCSQQKCRYQSRIDACPFISLSHQREFKPYAYSSAFFSTRSRNF